MGAAAVLAEVGAGPGASPLPGLPAAAKSAAATATATAPATSAAACRSGHGRSRSHSGRFNDILIDLRPQETEKLRLHDRPRGKERLVEIHHEGNGPAGDQGEFDVRPIFVGSIFHDGPALEEWGGFVVNHQPVAGLPNRGLDDVGNGDIAFAFAVECDGDGLFVLVVAGGQKGEGLVQFRVQTAH